MLMALTMTIIWIVAVCVMFAGLKLIREIEQMEEDMEKLKKRVEEWSSERRKG